MTDLHPHLISESNLSIAWAQAFLYALGDASDSLVVSLRGFEGELPEEDEEIAEALDRRLTDCEIPRISHTALTIAPYDRWNRLGRPSIDQMTEWYLLRFLPRLKARCSKNRYGTYFERFVSYSGVRKAKGEYEVKTVNQLSETIRYWKQMAEKGRRPRQSSLQLACFDPAKDHTGSALQGFPCLQQASLTYHEADSLEISAYYPTQYQFDRAYGNYRGLCQLGSMIAHELGVRFTRFTCFVARPELGTGSKTSHKELAERLSKIPRN